MAEPIELYFWPTPNGYKISIALEEMGLSYVLKPVALGKGEQYAPAFTAISPNNKMPAIIDPDGPGGAPISVFESGAILIYLARKSGAFYGRDERTRIEVEQWLFWQMGGLGPFAGQASHFHQDAPGLVDDPVKIAYAQARYGRELNRLCSVLDRRLAGRDYIVDDFSIADMACFPWARRVPFYGQSLDGFPNLKAWLDRVDARPGVQRGLAAGAGLRKPSAQVTAAEKAESDKNLFGADACAIPEATAKQS
jgi:GSH-dependent disulfide-bond oxidoreductase